MVIEEVCRPKQKPEKISNGQDCRTGTDERTDESEFIGSFRCLKTSGEPIMGLTRGLQFGKFTGSTNLWGLLGESGPSKIPHMPPNSPIGHSRRPRIS